MSKVKDTSRASSKTAKNRISFFERPNRGKRDFFARPLSKRKRDQRSTHTVNMASDTTRSTRVYVQTAGRVFASVCTCERQRSMNSSRTHAHLCGRQAPPCRFCVHPPARLCLCAYVHVTPAATRPSVNTWNTGCNRVCVHALHRRDASRRATPRRSEDRLAFFDCALLSATRQASALVYDSRFYVKATKFLRGPVFWYTLGALQFNLFRDEFLFKFFFNYFLMLIYFYTWTKL